MYFVTCLFTVLYVSYENKFIVIIHLFTQINRKIQDNENEK